MSLLTQIENNETNLAYLHQDSNESFQMECGRLINAAIISRRFKDSLLTNPVQSIEDGYCGEKFAFTLEEKRQIQSIRASSLADFSNQLLQVIESPFSMPAVSEMAYIQ